MVSAISANTGIITCGIFGSVMWWPEAELRSTVEGAGVRLPSEHRSRSLLSGTESPRSAMSKVLHRYFTPSSAALAQATLQRMHSSGDLQGSSRAAVLAPAGLQDSVDLDDGARIMAHPPSVEQAPPPEAAPAADAAAASEQAPPPEAAPAAERAGPHAASHHSSQTASSKPCGLAH